jgi:hypothetical protein
MERGLGRDVSGPADVDMGRWLRLMRVHGLVVAGLAERVAQPFETLIQTVTRCGAGGLDVLETLLARH